MNCCFFHYCASLFSDKSAPLYFVVICRVYNPQGDQKEEITDEKSFKNHVSEDLQEYFLCGDMVDFKISLESLKLPEMHHLLIKKAILLSSEKNQREREMVSQLLSFLYPRVLSPEQVMLCFVERFSPSPFCPTHRHILLFQFGVAQILSCFELPLDSAWF